MAHLIDGLRRRGDRGLPTTANSSSSGAGWSGFAPSSARHPGEKATSFL